MYSITKKAIILAILIIIPKASFAESLIDESEKTCLAKVIYHETRGEPLSGQKGVAKVVLNRKFDKHFPKTVCGVVNETTTNKGRKVCQFSWVCENNHQKFKPVYAKSFAESEEVAMKVYFEKFRLPSLNDALYYHATYVRPGWKKEKIAQIGQHIFYKE